MTFRPGGRRSDGLVWPGGSTNFKERNVPFELSGRRRAAGFSVAELLVVLAIVGVMAAIGARGLAPYMAQTRAITAARQVQWEVSVARSFAVRAARPMTLALDEANRVLTIRDSTGKVFRRKSFGRDSDLSLRSLQLDVPGDTLRFSERGLCLNCPASGPAVFIVTANDKKRYIRVGLLGRGQVESK